MTTMCTVCTLLPSENGWIAECGAARQGPYLSKAMAFRVAASEALALRRQGKPVQIAVRDESGEVREAYCLCREFKVAGGGVAARPD